MVSYSELLADAELGRAMRARRYRAWSFCFRALAALAAGLVILVSLRQLVAG